MADKLTPVTSEAQLRPGVLVELRGCRGCGGKHRAMLLRPETTLSTCRTHGICRGWRHTDAPCLKHLYSDITCFAGAVSERRLFIVDTGLDEKQDAIEEAVVQRQLRKKARVR